MIGLNHYLAWRSAIPLRLFLGAAVLTVTGCASLPTLTTTTTDNPAKMPAVEVGQAGGGRAVMVTPDKSAARAIAYVYQGQYSYVRIEQKEPGAVADVNQHPYMVDAATLSAALADIKIPGKKAAEPLFNRDELQELTPHLAAALAKVTPEQDVTFAISGRHNFLGPLAPRVVTTGRVFYQKDQLQLIFGLIHAEFEGQFRATGWLMPFEPGSRQKTASNLLKFTVDASRGQVIRPDWVALNLASSNDGTSKATPADTLSNTGKSGMTSSGAKPAAAGASSTPKPPEADQLANSIGERLKALDKLKRDGLVSEQEYQEKRKAILKDL